MTNQEIEALAKSPQSATSPSLGSFSNRPIDEVIRLQKYLDKRNGVGVSIQTTLLVPPSGTGQAENE